MISIDFVNIRYKLYWLLNYIGNNMCYCYTMFLM